MDTDIGIDTDTDVGINVDAFFWGYHSILPTKERLRRFIVP